MFVTTRMRETKNAYKILVGNPYEERSRRSWEEVSKVKFSLCFN